MANVVLTSGVTTPPASAPGSLTLEQMKIRIRRDIRDQDGRYIDDQEIADWINEALLDLAVRMRCIRLEGTGATDGTAFITLPSSALEVSYLRINASAPTGPQEVSFVNDDTWFGFVDQQFVMTTRTLGRVYGTQIELYPAPKTGLAFALRYIARPALLAQNTDTSEMPLALQIKALHYVRAQCKLKENELLAANEYMSFYEQDLPGPDYNAKFSPGPIQLFPVAGPFDTSDAQHI